MAHQAFTEIQGEMKSIAARIAKRRNLPSLDYRVVIRDLKKQQLVGDAILPFYQERLKQIEKIIAEQQIVSLPDRPARIRIATAAETAQQPAPHMVPPPFIHNTGQKGEFVLPLNIPAGPGQVASEKYDDFTFDAAAWTLTAHEARPGHELQFDSMLEHGVSLARVRYAFNSTNVEGWGLYSEYLIKPYMPLEGQLISLDFRLQRAARAFLDPELQAGKITPADAFRVLEEDVVLSHAFAEEEVERFTYRAPGQANSYFYGYTKLIALREDTEKALGAEVQPEEVSRLHSGAGPAAARPDAQSGDGSIRSRAAKIELPSRPNSPALVCANLATCDNAYMPKQFSTAITLLTAAMMLLGSALAQTSATTPTIPQPRSRPRPSLRQRLRPKPPLVLKTQKDKLSYAVGMNVGKNLQRQRYRS